MVQPPLHEAAAGWWLLVLFPMRLECRVASGLVVLEALVIADFEAA